MQPCCRLLPKHVPSPHLHTLPCPPLLPLQTNTWRAIADMGDSRAYGSSATLGSTVFAVGGLQSDMQVGGWVGQSTV